MDLKEISDWMVAFDVCGVIQDLTHMGFQVRILQYDHPGLCLHISKELDGRVYGFSRMFSHDQMAQATFNIFRYEAEKMAIAVQGALDDQQTLK